MDTQVLVALITVSGSIIVAAVTFYLNERAKRAEAWQERKLNHYKVLLSTLSDLAVDGRNKDRANEAFSAASNTITLIASQEVITALMKFHDLVKRSKLESTIDEHDKLLKILLLAIRKDIGLSKKDNAESFIFHLIGSKPK